MTQIKKALLPPDQVDLFLNKMIQGLPQTSNNWPPAWQTTTGNTQPEYDREYEVAKITKKHSKKYWYTISVSDTEDVHYIVYHTGNLKYWWFKLGGIEPNESLTHGWVSVTKRTYLPATLGAAYQEIDAAVAGYKETTEHEDYITEMLKTEPENLKMIEGLEKLEEGEPDENPNEGVNVSSATGAGVSHAYPPAPRTSYTYSNNVISSGTGTYSGNASATSKSIAGSVESVAEAVAEKTDKMMMELYKDGFNTTKKVVEADAQ